MFSECAFPDGIDVRHARLRNLYLPGSVVKDLRGDGVAVDGTVALRSGFVSHGSVRLPGARIGGDLDCGGAKFEQEGEYALLADCCSVEGNILLCRGFLAEGQVRLRDARIRGGLALGGCTVLNPDGFAIFADGVEVGANISLVDGAHVEGTVTFRCATVRGDFALDGCTLVGSDGVALVADSMRVGGSLFMRFRFIALGEVRLVGADIHGSLQCDGGGFIQPNGSALTADGATVDGDVTCGRGFLAYGQVRLTGIRVQGDITCTGATAIMSGGIAFSADSAEVGGNFFFHDASRCVGEFRLLGTSVKGSLVLDRAILSNDGETCLLAKGLVVGGCAYLRGGVYFAGLVDLSGAGVHDTLVWQGVRMSPDSVLDLRSAKLGVLFDDPNSWPREGHLRLDGLSYGSLHEDAPTGSAKRIEWLRRQPDDRFSSQPYEHLARVYKNRGQDREANRVQIAKGLDRLERGELPRLQKIGQRLLWATIGFGYSPWRALPIALVIVIAGALAFGLAHDEGILGPVQAHELSACAADIYVAEHDFIGPPPDAEVQAQVTSGLGSYPPFNRWLYSLDSFLPIVDLHQCSYWLPSDSVEPIRTARPPRATAVSAYLAVHIVLGWVLSALFVAGVSGLLRR
jgi:hypothetical protein